jgi:hypothetical protein
VFDVVGSFAFVDVAPLDDADTCKVQGQIAHVLNREQVEHCIANDCWFVCLVLFFCGVLLSNVEQFRFFKKILFHGV